MGRPRLFELDDLADLAGTFGTYRQEKKSLDDALDYAARHGKTAHALMRSVQVARTINQQSGGAVIAPWEVEQLDDEWIEVFAGLEELPKLRQDYQAFDKRLAEIRSKHPTYRKYQ